MKFEFRTRWQRGSSKHLSNKLCFNFQVLRNKLLFKRKVFNLFKQIIIEIQCLKCELTQKIFFITHLNAMQGTDNYYQRYL